MSSSSPTVLRASRWADLKPEYAALAGLYIREHGDGDVVIARAPGRVNLMGRHIDHQGGHVNMMAIDRSVRVVAGLRDDRLVRMVNLNSGVFGGREFSLDELLPGRGMWLDIVDSPAIRQRAVAAVGDWSQYAKAAIARLQWQFSDRRLRGVNLAVVGDVPRAAGLSSSSAFLMAVLEAAVELYGIPLPPEQFAELAGEAEWYVGTRGGAGDHAAIKLAKRGSVVQIGFFPLGMTASEAFPPDCTLLVCDSGDKAVKSAGAKDVFNSRVACYHVGRELIKLQNPGAADRITHLRDVNPSRLEITPTAILEMIAALPFRVSRGDMRTMLPESFLEPVFDSHAEPADGYPIRETVLFGLAECERSRGFARTLDCGNLEEIGRAMNLSHDGDRVERNASPIVRDFSDLSMQSLLENVESPRFHLAQIPGRYACSTPAIDRMVDIALSVDGAIGAQLAGAGLGGCMMALVRSESTESLKQALVLGYYEPRGIDPAIIECYPSTGSGLVTS